MLSEKARKEKARKVTERARGAVWAALWADPEYLRLNALKEGALHAWNRADAYQNHPSARPGELAKANADCDEALKACEAYERAALNAAGFPW